LTVAKELEQAERVIEDIEDLEEVEGVVRDDEHPEALARLQRLRDRRLNEMCSVRIRVAAVLLNLSTPTVYKWTELGLLEAVGEGVQRVTLRSVLEVRPLVLELRQLGKTRNLLQAVIARVEDAETFANPSLRQSIEQMRRGELVDIAP